MNKEQRQLVRSQLTNTRPEVVETLAHVALPSALDTIDEMEQDAHEMIANLRAALEPFARMFRWTNLPATDDDAQVLWRKHWLTGERMKLTTDHFRLAALAFYHGGMLPDIPDGEQQLAVAMAEEMDRWDKVKAMQAALDEFEKEDCD